MIYTITFNPSLDYIVSLDRLSVGLVNRTTNENIYPGGKGINVSLVLGNLGVESTALGFIAGFTGDEIAKQLADRNVKTDFIKLNGGTSRVNVKVHAEKNSDGSDRPEETEINALGPRLTLDDMKGLYAKLDALRYDDVLILAGSIPSSLPNTIYSDIMEYLSGRGIKIVIDATGKLLLEAIKQKPFLIKPNNHELGEIFGETLVTRKDVIPYARKLQEQGARNVLVSLAAEGAVLAAENGEIYETIAPDGKVVNAVGAGDSMVAGFLAGFMGTDWLKKMFTTSKYDDVYERALKVGVCTGSASAFTDEMATASDVKKLLMEM